ncbi:MAG: ABC transporter ATP-binding protein [Bacillota bacterium]|jgi:branched-chain amino acid transport system ATP-binding protein|nr:ABC transporter ATP-binding protein [Bacillota bacterium]MDD3297939.1 ABC transporter ATP-binding protein [Bacillota bacterium]MDD3850597.1 ABC transporter ATP-binding protein [Bacillota bacterium]MDD4707385.1 ABC transporter ATP-binding protein [Bacillota bacterium]
MSEVVLSLKNLETRYGQIYALKGISLDIREGEIVTLLGSNGAGKSTTLKTISSLVPACGGKVEFYGKDITNAPPHSIVEMGVIHVPEGRRIFKELNVTENLELASFTLKDDAERKRRIENVFELFPVLAERRKQMGGLLSGGEQQMLAIGRALMPDPKIVLLDEPSMGLAPIIVQGIMDIIKTINDRGTTILLVEQNAKVALKLADRGYVLETGEIVMEGDADKLSKDDSIVKAYLGH